MEKTINDEKKTALQLKKLLGRKKNQDLGNVERWKNIPVNYIVTANTLGIELNDYTLKRLNESEDKDHAFESVYLVQYFSKEARNAGKEELAETLEKLVIDKSIKTEQLAMYAVEEIRKAMPQKKSKKLIKKVEEASKNVDNLLNPRVKAKNTLDIVLLPINKEGSCAVYFDYNFKSTFNPMKNTAVNVYSAGPKKDSLIKPSLDFVAKEILSVEEQKDLGFMNLGNIALNDGGPMGLGDILGCGTIEALVFGFCGAVIGGVTGELFGAGNEGCAIGAGVGLVIPTYVFIRPAYRKYRKEANKKIARKLMDSEIEKINWIESKDLGNLCDIALKGAQPTQFAGSKIVGEAMQAIYSNDDTRFDVSDEFKSSYEQKLDFSCRLKSRAEKKKNEKDISDNLITGAKYAKDNK
ncbi:MAG: glycine zipper family protein [Candidatus Woesearchaeota archaeon]